VQRVVVLVDEVGRLVAHGSGKVAHEKALVVADLAVFAELRLSGQRQPEVVAVVVVHSGGEVLAMEKNNKYIFIELHSPVIRFQSSVKFNYTQFVAVLSSKHSENM
jgi:hypothetical protein